MMHKIFLFFILLLSFNAMGQSIEELEYDISWFSSHEKDGEKIHQARKLQKLDPFNYRATAYICRYYSDRKIDSVSIYFTNLIAEYPNKAEPYILRAELFRYETDSYDKDKFTKLRIGYLQKALQISPDNSEVIYKLAEDFYKDFIFPLEKGLELYLEFDNTLIVPKEVYKETAIEKSTYEFAADSSLYYFYKVWDLKKSERDVIYYPIRQLESYLKKTDQSPIPKDAEMDFSKCYFPSTYFTLISEDWETDYTTNLLYEVSLGKGASEWIKLQLDNLNEDCLYEQNLPSNLSIYRFTWLRTFNHPIAIRIEKDEKKVMIYWKVGKGAGGYAPKGLKKSGKKKLSIEKWNQFEAMINASDFHDKYKPEIPSSDGASWILEKKTKSTFKAYNSSLPSLEVSEACMFLLDLTRLKVKQEYRY